MDQLSNRIKASISSTKCAPFAESVQFYLDYLEFRLLRFDRLARKLIRFMDRPQQFLDFLTEAHWALILLHFGGNVEYEPLGESGPDLRICYPDNQLVDFHCKRLRNDSETAEKLVNYNGELVKYGNIENDTISIYDRITSEPPKLMDSTVPQIVAYWSDSERVEEQEFAFAINSIQISAADGRHSWLSGLIYRLRFNKQSSDFYYWYNSFALVPVPMELQVALRNLKPLPNIANCI